MAQEAKTTYSSNTIDPDTNGVGGKGVAGSPGSRNPASLQAVFKGSPLVGYAGAKLSADGEDGDLDYSDPAKLKAWFINNVVKGTVDDSVFGLGKYDLEFGNNSIEGAPSPPNLAEQALTADSPPANGFVPNPVSPGEGSVSHTTKDEAPKDFVEKLSPNGAAFAGDNIASRANLRDQSKQIVDRIKPPAQ